MQRAQVDRKRSTTLLHPVMRGNLPSKPSYGSNALPTDPRGPRGDRIHRERDVEIQTTAARSALMKRIRRERTNPEETVCRVLWSLGARYRRNVRDLPGTPDIANKSRRKAIFVHGCFWHAHEDCVRGQLPKRNRAFWSRKFDRNRRRDMRTQKVLKAQGFEILVVWCQWPLKMSHFWPLKMSHFAG